MKKVCVITASRAEYGILRPLLFEIQGSRDLELQLLIAGSHLDKGMGQTRWEVDSDPFPVTGVVYAAGNYATSRGTSLLFSNQVDGFAGKFDQHDPDIVVVLGDRYEVFAAATAASFFQIPIAHIHGGEMSGGSLDDAMRHATTKLSHLHFVATEEYRRRVIQLGEEPERVWTVGPMARDALERMALLSRAEVMHHFGLSGLRPVVLVAFHPVTLQRDMGLADLQALMSALGKFPNVDFIITGPGADVGASEILDELHKFTSVHSNATFEYSLGHRTFLSTLSHAAAIIGNSSSGIIEAPLVQTASINIGSRQYGRCRASSVVDCDGDAGRIEAALKKVMSPRFQEELGDISNPYAVGNGTKQIRQVLQQSNLRELVRKAFYDLKTNDSKIVLPTGTEK